MAPGLSKLAFRIRKYAQGSRGKGPSRAPARVLACNFEAPDSGLLPMASLPDSQLTCSRQTPARGRATVLCLVSAAFVARTWEVGNFGENMGRGAAYVCNTRYNPDGRGNAMMSGPVECNPHFGITTRRRGLPRLYPGLWVHSRMLWHCPCEQGVQKLTTQIDMRLLLWKSRLIEGIANLKGISLRRPPVSEALVDIK